MASLQSGEIVHVDELLARGRAAAGGSFRVMGRLVLHEQDVPNAGPQHAT